ncbi:hypothetical protein [Paludibacterium denitrificans]|uniref:Uncharacterized protein n=1 Tax=Paludibacterium denitrificans TaxID=2675226 RepID=A0A844GDB3_9NEIS|nr:hypothetical protein [Paludibacterium denitrificans]MTD33320.1 hypothetical protein [Paludibacterium denitrificans]
MKIKRDEVGGICDVSIYGRKFPFGTWSDLHEVHDSLLIVASGPSVAEVNFSYFENTPMMAVNGAYALALNGKVKFKYFLVVDIDFVKSRTEIVRAALSNPDLIFFVLLPVLKSILDQIPSQEIRCTILVVEDYYEPIFLKAPSRNEVSDSDAHVSLEDGEPFFSLDARKGVFDAGTVVFWGMQLAVTMGAKNIGLIGVDMNNFSSPRFYENEKDIQPTRLDKLFSSIISPRFCAAADMLKKRGVNLYNLSMCSALSEAHIQKISIDNFKKIAGIS